MPRAVSPAMADRMAAFSKGSSSPRAGPIRPPPRRTVSPRLKERVSSFDRKQKARKSAAAKGSTTRSTGNIETGTVGCSVASITTQREWLNSQLDEMSPSGGPAEVTGDSALVKQRAAARVQAGYRGNAVRRARRKSDWSDDPTAEDSTDHASLLSSGEDVAAVTGSWPSGASWEDPASSGDDSTAEDLPETRGDSATGIPPARIPPLQVPPGGLAAAEPARNELPAPAPLPRKGLFASSPLKALPSVSLPAVSLSTEAEVTTEPRSARKQIEVPSPPKAWLLRATLHPSSARQGHMYPNLPQPSYARPNPHPSPTPLPYAPPPRPLPTSLPSRPVTADDHARGLRRSAGFHLAAHHQRSRVGRGGSGVLSWLCLVSWPSEAGTGGASVAGRRTREGICCHRLWFRGEGCGKRASLRAHTRSVARAA